MSSCDGGRVPQRVNPRVSPAFMLWRRQNSREELLSGFTVSAMFEHLMAGICLARQVRRGIKEEEEKEEVEEEKIRHVLSGTDDNDNNEDDKKRRRIEGLGRKVLGNPHEE
ncbi:hypothetical protein M0802_004694 [Mischocyttarus mexicanus]|nr:hypothetical protein M0802_004694 [Mischocyttarus mexicanus]